MIFYGDGDPLFPPADIQHAVAMLEKAGFPVTTKEFPDSAHVAHWYTSKVNDNVGCTIKRNMRQKYCNLYRNALNCKYTLIVNSSFCRAIVFVVIIVGIECRNLTIELVQTAKYTGDRLAPQPSINFSTTDFFSVDTVFIDTEQRFQVRNILYQ